jgi:hypothetical protein
MRRAVTLAGTVVLAGGIAACGSSGPETVGELESCVADAGLADAATADPPEEILGKKGGVYVDLPPRGTRITARLYETEEDAEAGADDAQIAVDAADAGGTVEVISDKNLLAVTNDQVPDEVDSVRECLE